MYKLYGFRVSNYYNMIKLALMKKGLEFTEVETMPSAEENYLQKSPMGKVPCLEVDGKFLSETNVMLEFLEDQGAGTPLMPKDGFARAKVRELMKGTELYLELVARQVYRSVFFGEPLAPFVKDKVKPEIDKGVIAVNRLLRFSPYAAGAQFTGADIVLYYTVTLASLALQRVYDYDLVAAIRGAGPWLALMDKDPLVQKVNAERDAAFAAFMAATKVG